MVLLGPSDAENAESTALGRRKPRQYSGFGPSDRENGDSTMVWALGPGKRLQYKALLALGHGERRQY